MFRRPLLSGTWGLLLLWALPACSSADSGLSPAPTAARPTGAPNAASGPSIAFVDSDLQFLPGDVRPVTVAVTPPGIYDVRFSLSGDFRDAFLDQSQVESSADGRSTAMLTAPSSASTFVVRASVGAESATLPVSAGAGFLSIHVVPEYSGHRAVSTWTASVRTGSSCQDLSTIPPSDGPLVGEAAGTDVPIVSGVPAGVPLTVTVRAGHFAGGCTDLDGAVPGSSPGTVDVTVVDRPLQMADVSLAVSLGIDASAGSTAGWTRVADDFAGDFANHSQTDAAALLDAMLGAIPASSTADRQAFATARTAKAWDSVLAHTLHDGFGVDGLRDLVSSWIQSALPSLASAAVDGRLSSRAGLGLATFELSDFAGIQASTAGVPSSSPSSAIVVTWTAAPGDQVLFGGTPNWPLARVAASLALGSAHTQETDAKTVPDALSLALSCSDVAATLAPTSANGVAYEGCSAACVKSLCQTALGTMWNRAAHASTGATLIDFAATASATVSDDAHPSSFAGTWVGSIRVGDAIAKVTGTATGTE